MNVPNEMLDTWRILVDEVRGQLNALKFKTPPHTPAWDHMTQADDAARRLGLSLEDGGAQRPEGHVQKLVVPLHLLDTPANRRYLKVLEEAHAAALDVDDERGYGREGAGPAAGILEMLLAETQEEVTGPVGLVQE